MTDYEIFIETINPCGGEQYAKKEFIEAKAETPETYVKENGKYPIIDTTVNRDGDTVITTGDGAGSIVKYTFTE